MNIIYLHMPFKVQFYFIFKSFKLYNIKTNSNSRISLYNSYASVAIIVKQHMDNL